MPSFERTADDGAGDDQATDGERPARTPGAPSDVDGRGRAGQGLRDVDRGQIDTGPLELRDRVGQLHLRSLELRQVGVGQVDLGQRSHDVVTIDLGQPERRRPGILDGEVRHLTPSFAGVR